MSKIVILGAGISGHGAAAHLRRKLSKKHEVVVVSPNSNYQWIPSNIWVGIGRMKSKEILFPLAPLYKKKEIGYKQAKVTTFHPEGDSETEKPFVEVEVGENDFERKELELGVSDGIDVEIIAGLDENAKIKVWNELAEKDENSDND